MTLPVVRWLPFGSEISASARLRAFLPASILASKGWDTGIYSEADFAKTDILVFQKRYTTEDLNLAHKFKDAGKKVVFDLCDNHFYNPDNLPELTERANRLEQMISIADGVSVSTRELSKHIRHNHLMLIDDATEEVHTNWPKQLAYNLFRSVHNSGRVSIAWFGSSGSESPPFGLIDLGNIMPLLNEVNEVVPIRLNVFSDSSEAFAKYTKTANFPAVYYRWQKTIFPYYFSQHRYAILPITRNPFTDCKTSNRVILAIQLGVQVVTDRIPAYEEFSPFLYFSDWKNNLVGLLTNKKDKEVEQKLRAGKKYIEENYNTDTVYRQWSDFLTSTF